MKSATTKIHAGRISAACVTLAAALLLASPSFADGEEEPSVRMDAGLEWRAVGSPVPRLDVLETRLEHDWKLGPFTPSVEVRGWRTGFEEAPALIDDLRNQAAVRMGFAVPNWPMLSVSYAREQRTLVSSSWVGELSDAATSSASAMLWYGLGPLEISASSGFSEMADPVRGTGDWSTTEHAAVLTYRPTATLALSIGGGLQKQRYGAGTDWLGSTSITASAYYTLPEYQIKAFVWGSLIDNDDAYGAAASRNFDVALKISKELRRGWLPLPGKQSIGFEFVMSQYQDMVYSRYSSGAAIARLTFRVEN